MCQNLHQHAVECFLICVRISDGAGVKILYRFQCTVSVCTAVMHLVLTVWLSLRYTHRSDCKQNLFDLYIQPCDFACGFVWVFWLGLSHWGRNVGWCCSRTRELMRIFGPKKDEVTGEWWRLRGGADKSLARPTFRCHRMESIVSLERGACSCAELQVFSCYRGWKEACQATRAISTKSRRELSSSFFPASQGDEGNSRHSHRNIRGTCTIVCHRHKMGGPV